MDREETSNPRFAGVISPAILVSGVLLLLWSLLEPLGLWVVLSSDIFALRYAIGYVTILPSCLGLVWGGRWLRRSDLPNEYHRTVGGFTLLGGIGFLVFNLFLMLFFPTESIWIVFAWVRWALSLGLCIGLVVGISYSRGIFQKVSTERHSMRAEHLQQQRDLVHHMNGILRHEVLNAAQIVHGNAALLREEDESIEPDDRRIERIHRQGTELTRVIDEVRALLNSVDASRGFESYDLEAVLRSEIETIRVNYPAVEITADIPKDVTVEADDLIGRVFGNLLRNAVEHNETDDLAVTVDVELTSKATVVRIRDDGEGIPDRALDTLFDQPAVGTHGLGLYLVSKLMESYGGSVTLVETGANGTTFEVTFPRPDNGPTETNQRESVGTV